MVSRGPPALTASHLGDSSNTKLLSAGTNIWESVMKGLGEQEGKARTQRTPTGSKSTTGSGGGCGKGSGGVRTVECGGAPPCLGPLYSAPSCTGRPRGEGPGDEPRGSPTAREVFRGPWRLLNPSSPTFTPRVQTGKPRLQMEKKFMQDDPAEHVQEGDKEIWNDRGRKRQTQRPRRRMHMVKEAARDRRRTTERQIDSGGILLHPCP